MASASSAEEQFKEVLKSKSDMIAAAKVGESNRKSPRFFSSLIARHSHGASGDRTLRNLGSFLGLWF